MKFAECFHPSVVINEELAERGWTLRDLVFRMRRFEGEKDWALEMLAVEMYMVVHESGVILDDKMAEGFASALDVSAQLFKNLHNSWREWKLETESKDKS